MNRSVSATLLCLVIAACSEEPSRQPTPIELTVFAAASLRDVLAEAEPAYEAAVPGVRLTVSLDSSAALATQIDQGAPADVFLSADSALALVVVGAGLADGDSVSFASNSLTIVVPIDNPGRITSPIDLADPGVKIIAAGDLVPISRYASACLAKLAALPGYPSGFAAAYSANVVSKEENVRAVVAKLELGEGDAGIVYATDASAVDTVATVEIPPEANVRATYGGLVVRSSTETAAAHAFLAWFAGPDGQAILAEFGFQPVR